MKSNHSFKATVLKSALCLSLGFLFSGCASNNSTSQTSPSGVWAGRVGNYTYGQAAADYGTPTESHKLSNGGTTAEWITRRNVVSPASQSSATQIRAGGIDQPTGVNANPSSTFKNEYLRLNFDQDGKLTKWEKIYR